MARLLIVESPKKIKKLKDILGAGWDIAATLGHFRDLPSKEMGLEPTTLRPVYEITNTNVVERLQSAIRRADEVYLGTDPDREGEAIAWHVVDTCPIRVPVYRVAFGSITAKSVEDAIRSRRDIRRPLVQAQEARRVLDRLTGYMVSPALQRGSSAGRVQSPAIRLLVDREREIANHQKRQHFEVEAFAKGWTATWHVKPHLPEGATKPFICQDRGIADLVATTTTLVVADYKRGLEERSPPPPLTTSTLQQAASVHMGLSPDATMQAAQKLYEAGLISYHRTDSPNLSDEAALDIMNYLDEVGQPRVLEPRRFAAKGNAQEGHEAIRPCDIRLKSLADHPELGPNEQGLYQLIRIRALASQMANAVYEVARAVLVSDGVTHGGKPILWSAKGERQERPGWQFLAGNQIGENEKPDEEDERDDSMLPLLNKGDRIPVVCQVLAKKTRAAKRYTEASLVKRLEELGIGRPATYAAIIRTITRREYAIVEKRMLVPQPLAFTVVDTLTEAGFRFIEYDYTGEVEQELDRIASTLSDADTDKAYAQCVLGVRDRLALEIERINGGVPLAPPPPEPLEGSDQPCKKCSAGTMVTRVVKAEGENFGKRFLGCSERTCDHRVMPISEGWVERAPIVPLAGDGTPCPNCQTGKQQTRTIGKEGRNKGKRFLVCSANCGWRDFPAPEWPPRRTH